MNHAACPVAVCIALSLGFPLCHVVQAAECARAPYDCALLYVEHQDFQAAIRSLTSHYSNRLKI